jgi:hypothetical protein
MTQATGTFYRSTLTSNTGQLINDNRVPLPPSATYVPRDEQSNLAQDTSVADKVLKEQAEKLRRVTDLKQKISETQDGIVRETLIYDKNPSDLQKYRIEQLQADKDRYQKLLVEASESYSGTVSGQNNAPQKQSAWSKWWSGDKSDGNKYFQWSETPQEKYARLGSAYTRTGPGQ